MGNQIQREASIAMDWVHEIFFPMYVVKVADLLRGKLTKHGQPRTHGFLLQENLLHEWMPGMCVIFVSHQWLSKLHPDPEGQQFEVLRAALQSFADRSLPLSLDGSLFFHIDPRRESQHLQDQIPEAYVWMDWFGVPQITARTPGVSEDMSRSDSAKAVQSIPGYVERCSLFFALTPELPHNETGVMCNSVSWYSRGWCQAELFCALLSSHQETPTVVTIHSRNYAELVKNPIEWDALHTADFTVESDRLVIWDLMKRSVRARIQRRGSDSSARRRYFLTGEFKLHQRHEWEIDEFLQKFEFAGMKEAAHDTSPMTGLLCAILSGDHKLVRALVNSMADVNQRCHGLVSVFGQQDQQTMLMVAAKTNQDPAVLSTLIELRADVNATDAFGAMVAGWASSPGQVQVLAQARADLHTSCCSSGGGAPPLNMAAAFQKNPETLTAMIAFRCDVNKPPRSVTSALHVACVASRRGSVEKAKVLIAHRADVNVRATAVGILGCMCRCAQLMSQCSGFASCSQATKVLGSLDEITPLGMAALYGDLALTQCLLEAGADRSIANARGDPPVVLALAQGHHTIADELMSF